MQLSHYDRKKTEDIYIDNKQIIEYFFLPNQGTRPSKFTIDHLDLLSGIKHYSTLIKTEHKVKIQLHHIYIHLENKQKRENINEAWNRNCNQEVSLHHNTTKTLPTPTIPNSVQTTLYGTLVTSKI